MDRWNHKVAIVTGASSGIGKTVAIKLVQEGMIVAGLARRKEKLDQLATCLNGHKGQFHAIQTDVTKEEDILKAFEYITQKLGPVHVLINNAGIGRFAPLTSGKTEQWRAVLETNVLGLSIITREAIQNMISNNIHGHIVHINSVGGHSITNTYIAMYTASKSAVTSLTEAIRQELNLVNSKIKVTSISPGHVESHLTENTIAASEGLLSEEFGIQFKKINPALNSEDIADCIVYILGTPSNVQINEVIIRPIGETL